MERNRMEAELGLADGPTRGTTAMEDEEEEAAGGDDNLAEFNGFGKIGVTCTEPPRKRLRALRNMLNVAMGRLANNGNLIISWNALPSHPMLFFISAYLRTLFLRVHVTTMTG